MKVDVNATRVTALLDRTVKALPQEIDRALAVTASQGINLIQDRTSAGRGYRGGFVPYSPSYFKFRQKKGRQTSPVDLNFTGRMLGSMARRRIGRGVEEIYFTRSTESRKAFYNNRLRPFFGFNQTEKRQLSQVFRKALMK